MYQKADTLISLTSSSLVVDLGQNLTLYSTTIPSFPGSGILTGSVTYMDGNITLGVVPISSNGTSSVVMNSTTKAYHNLIAMYSGDSYFNPSNTSITLPFGLVSTSTVVYVSANSTIYGQNTTLYGQVVLVNGTATGTISFIDGTTVIGTSPITIYGNTQVWYIISLLETTLYKQSIPETPTIFTVTLLTKQLLFFNKTQVLH